MSNEGKGHISTSKVESTNIKRNIDSYSPELRSNPLKQNHDTTIVKMKGNEREDSEPGKTKTVHIAREFRRLPNGGLCPNSTVNSTATLVSAFNNCSISGNLETSESLLSNQEALQCKRLYIRRGALCDPEKMPMPQWVREEVQRDVDMRKSFKRKLTNFLTVHFNLDKEEDLF